MNDASKTLQLLAVGDVAALLRISPRAVWRFAASGKLPAPIHVGRACRWRLADLEKCLEDLTGG